MGGLRSATLITLDENHIRVLPYQICNLSNLIQLSLKNNAEMVQPPQNLAARGGTREGVNEIVEFLTRFQHALLAEYSYLLDIRGCASYTLHPSIYTLHSTP